MAVVTITTGYNGKIAGSLIENSNIAKGTELFSTIAVAPLPHETGLSEYTQMMYDMVEILEEGYGSFQRYNDATSKVFNLYSFDVIDAIEANYGETLWRGKTLLTEKIAVAKEIVTNIVCSASGKSPGVTSKYLNLSAFDEMAYDTPVRIFASAVTTLSKSVPNTYIDSNGYVHFLFHNDSGANQFMEVHYAGLDITLDDSLAPEAPTGLTGSPEIGAINLSWTGVTGATGYNVYRSDTSETGYELIGTTGEMVFVDHTSATDSTTYYYVVTAQNEVGTSEYSNEATAQAIPEPQPQPEPQAEYTERNIFIPEQYWTGDGINQEAREIIVKKYNAGARQTITSQYPFICLRTYH